MLRSCAWVTPTPLPFIDETVGPRVEAVRIVTSDELEWLPTWRWRTLRETVIRSSWPVKAARMEVMMASSPSLISHCAWSGRCQRTPADSR